MTTIRHLFVAAVVVIAGATPVLSGCPSTSTSVASPRAAALEAARSERAAPDRGGAEAIVPVAFIDDGPWQPKGEVPAPITLHAADGTELGLRKVKGRSVVEGPLAFTELELSFENRSDRTVEGRFRIALPGNAAVSRFAMRIDGRWQEAEVVEKQRARRTFEDFLHRKQDPALLEQAAGNEFSARVFPIPPRSTKQLTISYSQEITSRSRTLVPLRGLPEVGELDLAVVSPGSRPSTTFRRAAYAPTGDFTWAAQGLGTPQALRNGDLALARITPPLSTEPDELSSAVVLVDTSASRTLGLAAELRLVDRIAEYVAAKGGADAPFAVAGFDQRVEGVGVARVAEWGDDHRGQLAARGALGASDFRRALRWAAKTAKRIGARRVVLVTDGVATAGPVERRALRRAAKRLAAAGVARLDALAVGGIRDDGMLKAMVTAGLERHGVVADGDRPWGKVVAKLVRRTAAGLAVTVEGATWQWPRQLDGVQAGDEVIVHAELPAGAPLRIRVGDQPIGGLKVAQTERPLIERSWAGAKIASLLDHSSRGRTRASVRSKIIELSTTHRVLCPYTSLLVLETEWDYRRFGLERRALADVLTIENDRLTVLRRSQPAAAPAPTEGAPPQLRAARPPEPAASEAAEFGMVGMVQDGSTAPWGRDDSLGNDPLAARGNMWGDQIGDAFGAGGLGLAGAGEGGGGRGE
ncbi:MAG: hypothetical protein JRI23_24955, partial [Deltaproteobacteria bacterium]|nr:hypothetical protein [Deltaproteobacteria bacterium]MBW2535266.1 hypothetical protein [Deltaproteobacteria bacterium]